MGEMQSMPLLYVERGTIVFVVSIFFYRAFFNLQRPVLGRCSEIGKIDWAAFSWMQSMNVNCMKTVITRIKTGDLQELHVFLHAYDVYSCPLHSLACQIVLSPATSRLVFPEIEKMMGVLSI
jgi:hypothetical protein